jgi:hypothetical protein
MIEDEEWGEPREFLAGLMMMDASVAQLQVPEVNLRVAEGRARLGPVYDWWRELLHRAEAECLTYLQSKPVGQPPDGPPEQSALLSMEPAMTSQGPFVQSTMPPMESVVRSSKPLIEPVVRSVMPPMEPVVRTAMRPPEPVVQSSMLLMGPVVRSVMPLVEPVVRSAMPLIEPVVRSAMPLMDSGRGHAMHPFEPAASRIRTLGYAAQNIQDIFNILKR